MCRFNLHICPTCGVPRSLLSVLTCGDCGDERAGEKITTDLHRFTLYGGETLNELGRFVYPNGSSCFCPDVAPSQTAMRGAEGEVDTDDDLLDANVDENLDFTKLGLMDIDADDAHVWKVLGESLGGGNEEMRMDDVSVILGSCGSEGGVWDEMMMGGEKVR